MNILVTGGAGFIGSNFVHYMLQSYETYKIINYDALTYSGNLNNVKSLLDHPNYSFCKGRNSKWRAIRTRYKRAGRTSDCKFCS